MAKTKKITDGIKFMGTLFKPEQGSTTLLHGSHDDFYIKVQLPFTIEKNSRLYKELNKYLKSIFNWIAWTIYNYQVNPNIISILSVATNNQAVLDVTTDSPENNGGDEVST